MINEKMVHVEWQDSNIIHGWRGADFDLDDVAYCETLGFLVSSTKRRIIVAQSRSNEGTYLETIAIPRGCITKIRELRL